MASSILVLGAGMVGTCTALHLQQRGFDVVLVDRLREAIRRLNTFKPSGLSLRLSIGLEDPDDLIADLAAAFDRMQQRA